MFEHMVEARYRSFEEYVKHVADGELFILGKGSFNNSQISFNVEKRQDPDKEKKRYALKYFPAERVFVAWNLERRRRYNGTLNFTLNADWKCIQPNRDCIYVKYCYFESGDAKILDKIVVLGETWLEDFLDNTAYWMALNPEDQECSDSQIQEENIQWPSDRVRKEYSVKQKQRKADFRRKVLDAYGHRCAICQIDVEEVLQAAHIRPFTVANTDLDADIVEHGICLCANHHLMYDKELIDIDVKAKKIYLLQDCVKGLPWCNDSQASNFFVVEK